MFDVGTLEIGQRQEIERFMTNLREHATLNLALTRKRPSSTPFQVEWLERHPHSSQAFVSIDLPGFLVMVTEPNPNGTPDLQKLRAFRGARNQGMCYHAGVWHHPFVTLGGAGEYLTLRYDDGSEEDTLWHRVEDGPNVAP